MILHKATALTAFTSTGPLLDSPPAGRDAQGTPSATDLHHLRALLLFRNINHRQALHRNAGVRASFHLKAIPNCLFARLVIIFITLYC